MGCAETAERKLSDRDFLNSRTGSAAMHTASDLAALVLGATLTLIGKEFMSQIADGAMLPVRVLQTNTTKEGGQIYLLR